MAARYAGFLTLVVFARREFSWLNGWLAATGLAAFCAACAEPAAPSLSKHQPRGARLSAGESAPAESEVQAAGAIQAPIQRGQQRFRRLVQSTHPRIVFKDEEGTGADRLMTRRLRQKLHELATRVHQEWPEVDLRVTEAWDEDSEHGKRSLHYEGRAADLTASDKDVQKLGRLAGLAVEVGFDWVYFENASHVHVSVRP